MAYGRVDIYWPDGRLESHMLRDETVSVGRAEGNTIALDTDTLSRYHFSLVREGDKVVITDLESANGTYVDGVQLKQNQGRPLGAVEEIQAGYLRIIYRKFDDSPTIPTATLGDETEQIGREEAGYRVEVDLTHLEVWPAASSSAEIAITNVAEEMQRFAVRVSGMPGEWLRINRPELNVSPDETGYALINIKPPRRPETQPGQYQVQVEILPIENPEAPVHITITVDVRAYEGFGIALVPQADIGEPVAAFLHNQGSAPLTVSLTATDPQKALAFQLPKTPLTLQAGQRLKVDIHAQAVNPQLTGAEVTYPFILQVRSHTTARYLAATGGRITIAPRFPMWALVSAGGIALSIVLLLALALSGLLNTPDPSIENLAVSAERVAQGEELLVSWDAEDIDTLRISVNQQLVADGLPGDTESYSIDTNAYDGEILIGIFGETGSISTNQEIMAEIYRPLTIDSFNTEPETIVRNVVSSITISWDVPGATDVTLSGLSEFTTGRVPNGTEFPSQHTLTESGIPTGQLSLILTAQDTTGATLEREITVPTVDPVCTALADTVLREGPDERFQQVSSAAQDTTVVVLSQDADAGWLRVQLPGDVRAWGPSDAFTCADNFAISDLRVESNIPVLPPETQPSPAATATVAG